MASGEGAGYGPGAAPASAGAGMSGGGGGHPPGTQDMYLADYRMGKTLGIGSFGKVKLAEHVLTQEKVAIKILNRRKIMAMDMEEKVSREMKVLKLFMHPSIIRLYEIIQTPTDIYVVMEYVKAGELFDYIVEKGRLHEDEGRKFFQQIISGVEYCHRNMVVHRDLKPENLLLDGKKNVKIADFGLSNLMRDGRFLKTSCGSPNYAAPEVISGKMYSGPEVDVWSCGVILYALLCGSLPFDDENIPNLFKKIKGGVYTLPSHLSAGARDLIPRMLVVNPMDRITIPEIRQHPWYQINIPTDIALPPPDTVQQLRHIDDEIVTDVVAMGFDRTFLLDSLHRIMQNKATVTYHLIRDRRKGQHASQDFTNKVLEDLILTDRPLSLLEERPESQVVPLPGTPGLEAQLSSPGMSNPLYGMPPPNALPVQHVMKTQAGPAGIGGVLPIPAAARINSSGQLDASTVDRRMSVEKRWNLGITRLSAYPGEVMAEVYRALHALGCQWKRLSPYAVRFRLYGPQQFNNRGASSGNLIVTATGPHGVPVRVNPGSAQHLAAQGVDSEASSGATQSVLRGEVQLYKLRDNLYTVDLTRLSGPLPLFLDASYRLRCEITRLERAYLINPAASTAPHNVPTNA